MTAFLRKTNFRRKICGRVEDMPPEDALNDESNLSASETVAEDMENGDVKADEGEATKDGEEAESSRASRAAVPAEAAKGRAAQTPPLAHGAGCAGEPGRHRAGGGLLCL